MVDHLLPSKEQSKGKSSKPPSPPPVLLLYICPPSSTPLPRADRHPCGDGKAFKAGMIPSYQIHHQLVCVPFPQVIIPANYIGRHDHTAKYAVPRATINSQCSQEQFECGIDYQDQSYSLQIQIHSDRLHYPSSVLCSLILGPTCYKRDLCMFLLARAHSLLLYTGLHKLGTFIGIWHEWHPGIASKELRLGLLQQVTSNTYYPNNLVLWSC